MITNYNSHYSLSFGHRSFSKISGLRSMQHIKDNLEREIIESYRNELTHDIWGNAEKLKQWANGKIDELATKEYPSKLIDDMTLREGRVDAVDKWYQYITNDAYTKNKPFLKLKIMKFVTSNLLPNNKQLAPIINPSVIIKAAREISKTGASFKKTYYKLMREFDTSLNVKSYEVSENGVLGKWYIIRIPDEAEARKDIGHFNKIKNYVAILSQNSNWCTRSPYTVGKIFSNCTLHIFVDNKGIPQLCLTSIGKSPNRFKFIRANDQYKPLSDKFKGVLKTFLIKNNIINATYENCEKTEPLINLLI